MGEDRDYAKFKKWIEENAPDAVQRAYWIMVKAETERDAAVAALAAARDRIGMAEAEAAVWSGKACEEEQAAGNGPCGACRFCLPKLLAAANARATHAETNIIAVRKMLAQHVSEKLVAQEALAAARRECEQAESERDAASEVLRDALAWEAETRGRLGLPQIDAPMWAQIASAALGDGCALDENEQVKRLTAAMREADRAFEDVGGSTRHHVRDCLLPILAKHGLRLVAALAAPGDGRKHWPDCAMSHGGTACDMGPDCGAAPADGEEGT